MSQPLKMNRNRRRNVSQPHGVGRQVPGCLSRMVNLFDFGTVGKKLLTDKPYFDHAESIKRNQIEDKVGVRNGTPMKMLLAEEMSKEMEFNLCSSNLVAKLMGLDSFPDAVVRTSKPGELSRKKMDIVRDKFLEAKRLVTDDKLRNSKEFQEAMEVLSSNKELFLEFLQESNNFFSHHLQSFQSIAPPPTPEKSKRITILKPSKKLGSEAAANESPRDGTKSEKGLHMFKWPGEEEYPRKQSTRIVVLKPNGHVGLPADDFEEMDIKDVARRVKLKEENLHSSVYIGDDSYYADSEIISPVCRHSWDYVNKYDSPFSSPESSSVCREAKKRLSERWALMAASNENFQEDKVVQKKGGNISLGDMLALSDSKRDIITEDEEANDGNEEQDHGEEGNLKPFNSLMRSKSLPESSTSLGKGKSKVPEELTKSKSMKWSLSNFLFSRNKKASKDEESHPESLDSRYNDECDASVSARSMVSREAGLSMARSTTFGNSSEWRDEPSPSSVLETCFDEDDGIFFNSSVLNEPEMMSMKSNLLGKSPSIGRNVSFDDSTVARCYSSKRSTRDEEEDFRLLINTLLSASDLEEESDSSSILDKLLSKWHSLESPLDPSLRDSYANSTEQQRLGSDVKKLVFDLVNTLLLELTPSYLGPKILAGKTLGVYVINRMQEFLKVEDRWWDEDGDLSSLAVNKVVRMEVAEIGSPESLRLEMDSMGEELELKLLEELVDEAFMDLSQQPKTIHSKYVLII